MSTFRLKKASTALIKAREVLATGKWCRGELKKGEAHCAIGALYEVTHGYDADGDVKPEVGPWSILAIRAGAFLDDATEEITGEKLSSVVDFNDEFAKSKKNVLAVYDRAIQLAKKSELRAWRQGRKAQRAVSA